MHVKLDEIPGTGLLIDAELPLAFVDALLPDAQELHAEEPGHTKLRLTRHDDNVLVDGSAQASFVGECASCLGPLQHRLKTKVALLLVPAAAPKKAVEEDDKRGKKKKDEDEEEGVELSGDDDSTQEYHDRMIDWGDVVRQQLLLVVPIAPRCKDDCKGLCPSCGIDRNHGTCACVLKQTDPRWDKLKELKLPH